MQTNFFGPLWVIQAALEGMRARKTGTIVNFSSIAAKDPLPTCALYSASKMALEGFSESLAAEVKPFGIDVLIVEPGNFRTNFLNGAMVSKESCPPHYEQTPIRTGLDKFAAVNGKQEGDPAKGVERIFEVVTGEGMAGKLKGKVLRLMLGSDAAGRMKKNNDKFLADMAAGEEVTMSTKM
jgi:NAD(P)-dependent dehydrogenase (short-subunit alcohol dehydrogenase family)